MNKRECKKRVSTAFRKMVGAFSYSQKGDLPEVIRRVKQYWRGLSRSPQIIVDERVIRQHVPQDKWAGTEDGYRVFVRIGVARTAPGWVLEAVLAHELAHIVLSALKGTPTSRAGMTGAEVSEVEGEVLICVHCMGFDAPHRFAAQQWLERHLPRHPPNPGQPGHCGQQIQPPPPGRRNGSTPCLGQLPPR